MLTIPRPKHKRTIRHTPRIHYFNPQGTGIVNPVVELSFDELEAMRLKHNVGKTQDECANLMKVSQSTFSRILDQAHTKITDALLEGRSIHLNGGEYDVKEYFLGYGCLDCSHEWEIELDKIAIPLEPTEKDIEKLLPYENVICTNNVCKSSNIYRLVRDDTKVNENSENS